MSLLIIGIEANMENNKLQLSYTQEHMWHHEIDNPSYQWNVPYGIRLTGNVDHKLLEKSFNLLVERCENFRTCFPVDDDAPFQKVMPYEYIYLSPNDLRDCSVDEAEKAADNIVQKELRRPFDIKSERCVRLFTFMLPENEHIIYFVYHHIVSDVMTMSIAADEFASYYSALSQDNIPENNLGNSFSEFSEWEREKGKAKSDQVFDYWKDKLLDKPLEIPTDHLPKNYPSKDTHEPKFGMHVAEMPRELVDEVVDFFPTSLSAAYIALYLQWKQSCMTVSSALMLRNRPQFLRSLGCFYSRIVFQAKILPEMTGEQIVEQVKLDVINTNRHRMWDVRSFVESFFPERLASGGLLANVEFQLLDIPYKARSKPIDFGSDVDAGALVVEKPLSSLDLKFTFVKHGSLLLFKYNEELYDRETLVQLGENYKRALEYFVLHPNKTLSDFFGECNDWY